MTLDVRGWKDARSLKLVAKLSCGALAAAASLAVAPPARASGTLGFAWRAPSECPTEAEVRAEILRIAGDPAAVRASVDASVNVVRTEEGAYRADLSIGGATRSLDGDTCDAVARAVAVVVAIALEPEAPPSREPPREAPPAPPAPREERPEPPHVGQAASFSAGARAIVDTATLPKPAAGAAIDAGVRLGRVGLELEIAALAPVRGEGARPSEGGDFAFARAGGRACFAALESGAVAAGPCAGAGIEWTHARGVGAPVTSDADAFVLAPTAGGEVRWRVAPVVSLRAVVEAALPLARPTFVTEGGGPVHRASIFSARAGIGAELHF